MPRLITGRRRAFSHGMLVLLDEDSLMSAALPGLIRLAEWLGIKPVRDPRDSDEWWHTRIVRAIMREEKRLSRCPKRERWERGQKSSPQTCSPPTNRGKVWT